MTSGGVIGAHPSASQEALTEFRGEQTFDLVLQSAEAFVQLRERRE